MIWIFNSHLNVYLENYNKLRKSITTVWCVYKTHLVILKLINVNLKNLHILTYTSTYNKKLFNILYYTNTINIKYAGKIFKIKKFKKILILTFNYPIFKYLIWNNIKLKWKKKPKRVFFFYIKTYSNLFQMFWYNLIYLRPLNTYTTRGIYNNLFLYQKRKKKVTNKR